MNKTTSRSAAYLFNAFDAKTGDALAKLVLLSLANRADDQGQCWPSLAKIAEDCETSESSVKRKLVILEGLGLIRRINRSVEGMKTSNIYQLSDRSQGHIVGSEGPQGRVTVTPGDRSERPIKHAVETRNETPNICATLFATFWEAYPRKTNKKLAQSAFRSSVKDLETLNAIITNIQERIEVGDWELRNKGFIPHPTTYLNGKRWEDEVVPRVAQKPNSTELARLNSEAVAADFSKPMGGLAWIKGI